MGRRKVHSVMDAASSVWSVRLHPDDMDKTAFSSRKWGLLRFTRMPFGLKSDTLCGSHNLIPQGTDTCFDRIVMETSNCIRT